MQLAYVCVYYLLLLCASAPVVPPLLPPPWCCCHHHHRSFPLVSTLCSCFIFRGQNETKETSLALVVVEMWIFCELHAEGRGLCGSLRALGYVVAGLLREVSRHSLGDTSKLAVAKFALHHRLALRRCCRVTTTATVIS